jgi:uncharacterized membrane protein YcaP (DUF421 family)
MDPFRIGVRSALAYIFLLLLLRLAGKRTIYQATPFDFVLALVLGDIVDDALWSEVPMAQFVVAAASLVLMKLAVSVGMGRTLGGERAVAKREGRAP